MWPQSGKSRKRREEKERKEPCRKKMIKTVLIGILAWAAIKNKKSYCGDKHFRLKGRLGSKKAILAIVHRIAKALVHIIKHGAEFKDLGKDYLSLLHATGRYECLQRETNVTDKARSRSCLTKHQFIPLDPRPTT